MTTLELLRPPVVTTDPGSAPAASAAAAAATAAAAAATASAPGNSRLHLRETRPRPPPLMRSVGLSRLHLRSASLSGGLRERCIRGAPGGSVGSGGGSAAAERRARPAERTADWATASLLSLERRDSIVLRDVDLSRIRLGVDELADGGVTAPSCRMAKEVTGVSLPTSGRSSASFTLGHSAAAATRLPCLLLLCDCALRGAPFQSVAGSACFVPEKPSSSSELFACLPPCAATLAERPQAQKQGSLITQWHAAKQPASLCGLCAAVCNNLLIVEGR